MEAGDDGMEAEFQMPSLDASEITELPALPFGEVPPMAFIQPQPWATQKHEAVVKQEPGAAAAATAATAATAPAWSSSTPPSSVSPPFSVASSPERDSDSDGCTTPSRSLQVQVSGSSSTQQADTTSPAAQPTGATPPPAQPNVKTETSPAAPGQLPLGPHDAKKIEAQREQRLRRNREAAQQFRKRKKEYVTCVEQDCERLRNENTQLRAQLSAANAENNVLREENRFYKDIVNGRTAAGISVPAGGSRVTKAVKVTGVAMCGMMMVMGFLASQPVGGSPAVGAPAAAPRRRLAMNNSEASGPVVPLPGELWNASEPGTNMSDTHKWLSLLHPREDYTATGSARHQQRHLLGEMHSGYLQRDELTGAWGMDWDMLARFGRLSTPPTRYIFCPDAQDLSAISGAPVRRQRDAEQAPEIVQLWDEDDERWSGEDSMAPAPKGNELATLKDVQRLELEALQPTEPSSQLAVPEGASARHPPDFDAEDLEQEDGDWTAREGFGVSLLIPTGASANGSAAPSVQMVEFRCEVANVTHHTFVAE